MLSPKQNIIRLFLPRVRAGWSYSEVNSSDGEVKHGVGEGHYHMNVFFENRAWISQLNSSN